VGMKNRKGRKAFRGLVRFKASHASRNEYEIWFKDTVKIDKYF